MKKGVNNTDRVNIAEWYKSGASVEEISNALKIHPETIKAFAPDKVKESDDRKAKRNAALAKQHNDIMDKKLGLNVANEPEISTADINESLGVENEDNPLLQDSA